jgi:hypothetical protein
MSVSDVCEFRVDFLAHLLSEGASWIRPAIIRRVGEVDACFGGAFKLA